MAKPIQEVSQDRLAKFDEIVKDIMETKAHIAECQQWLVKREEELLELCSAVEPTSDFEGTESMKSGKYQVGFVYKLTRKIDKEKADGMLSELGMKPEHFFNVKYDYSATLFKMLTPESQRVVQDSMITKRAKTAIEIKPLMIEGKEE